MTPEQSAELAKPIRTLQIIVGAMILGVITFLAIALTVGPQVGLPAGHVDGQPSRTPMISYVAVACGAVLLVASLVVPQVVVGAGRRKIAAGTWQPGQGSPMFSDEFFERTGDAGRLYGALFMGTIIGAAILEGGGLLAGVAYLVEGQLLAVGVAVVLLFALALRFPTRARVEQQIAEQLELVQQDRSRVASLP